MISANELLDLYTDIILRKSDLDSKKQALIDEILTHEIKQALDDVDAEFRPLYQALNDDQAVIEPQLKYTVIQEGKTVKGKTHMAVYSKGRVSWDTKMLEGLAMVIPQVGEARKDGDPSVSIRLIK